MSLEIRRESAQVWFFERLAARFAGVFEILTAARPDVRIEPIPDLQAVETGGLQWSQAFDGVPGAVHIQALDQAWTEASNRILRAAGIENADGPTLRATWFEALVLAMSGIAQDFSERLGQEVVCGAAGAVPERSPEDQAPVQPVASRRARLSIAFQGESPAIVELVAGIEVRLLESLMIEEAEPKTAAAVPAGRETPGVPFPGLTSKTFDLLLDVEMPVSVSFGRAQVPLKDLIKLTTGAIVELNRSITEPVEVIVNNCVIARGEVVVVEGNFGVRIREVISRQDRLRTLN